jgi:hypothetical protein
MTEAWAIWIAGALFSLAGAVILWTRRDLKGMSKRAVAEHNMRDSQREAMIAALIESTDECDPAKRRTLFTRLLRKE